MPLPDPAAWSDLLRQSLGRYDEPLLRRVAAKLVRTRSQWPADELIDRATATVLNAAVNSESRALSQRDRSGCNRPEPLNRALKPTPNFLGRFRLGHV